MDENPDMPLAERLLRWHKARHSFDPVYMSDQFTEYLIVQKDGKWKIKPYHGLIQHPKTSGTFSSFKEAEMCLIAHLVKTNRHGHARYPGCPKPRQTNSTELFLKDWSPKPVP